MTTAIYPGSFDPVTVGHLDIMRRAASIFDKLTVAVMINRKKNAMFTPDERMDMVRAVSKGLPNVTVTKSEGLLADFARDAGASVILKGLRAVSDFEHEFQMALMNKKMNPELDTLFLMTDERHMYLSSSAVKEVASFGGDISDFIPAEILGFVSGRMRAVLK